MKRISLVVALLGVAVLAFAGVAMAGKVGLAKTWVYDQDSTDQYPASATWTKDGLSLKKDAPLDVAVAAGATFKGVEGQRLSQLSLDVKGSSCGGGAPRSNVTTDAGTAFFGCV